jgi:hypothetical protein
MASDNGGYDYYEDEVRLELDMDDEMLLKQDTPPVARHGQRQRGL